MPAGPAPTTATRRGRSADGRRGVPSSGTTGILPCPRPPDTSSAGQVAVEAALHVLREDDLAAGRERCLPAVGLRSAQRARPGQPAGTAGEIAGRGHATDDLPP